MKKRFRERHPYSASILAALLCTFMTALGTAIPEILGFKTASQLIITTIFLIISVFIGIIIIKKANLSLTDCGFRTISQNTLQKVWFYIPLILLEISVLALSEFSSGISLCQYLALFFFVIAVGFNEEIYFRGIVYNFLLVKGSKKAIIGSSVIFGLLHLANAFNGKNVTYLVLQVIFAFFVGIVLAEIISITRSIWFLIIWHGAHDYIASVTNGGFDTKAIIALALQVIILLIYTIGIWKTSLKNHESDFNHFSA